MGLSCSDEWGQLSLARIHTAAQVIFDLFDNAIVNKMGVPEKLKPWAQGYAP